jgi:hypothetical protein
VGTAADLLWSVLTSASAQLGFKVLTVVLAALAAAPSPAGRDRHQHQEIVQTLRTARSATIEINGHSRPDLTDTARDILNRLRSGH